MIMTAGTGPAKIICHRRIAVSMVLMVTPQASLMEIIQGSGMAALAKSKKLGIIGQACAGYFPRRLPIGIILQVIEAF